MRILVIGRTGQIATELLAQLPAAGHESLALEPPDFDMTDAAQVAAAEEAARQAAAAPAHTRPAPPRRGPTADMPQPS